MVRRAGSLILSAVLAGTTLAGAALVGVEPARPAAAAGCEGGLTSAALNDLIRGTRRGAGGLAGMDYAHAQRLPDGRVLWLFQDAFLGDVSHLDQAAFVHNAGLIQFGSCVKVLHSGTRSRPRSWLGASGETLLTRWFWPLDAAIGSDGHLRQFMVEMYNPNRTGAAVGAAPVRVWIATIRLSDLRVLSFATAPDDGERPLYGFSITSDDSWTYLYGHCYRQYTNPGFIGSHDLECGPDVYVARVPKGELTATPHYWNGSDWLAGRANAAPVMRRGSAANPMQVRYVDGTYLAVTKIDDWFGLRVYIDTAPSPTGPWTEVGSIQPDLVCGACTTYFAHLLPWRDADGSLLVAISNNAWSFSLARANPAYYRPRIMSIRPPDGVTMPEPPADCTISTTLRRGSAGSQTRCLRRRLAQLGYAIDTRRSTFDATVRAAVIDFQTVNGLGADGVVGPATGRALGIRGGRTVSPGAVPGPTSCKVTSTLRAGSRGSQVACLNARLVQLGYTITGRLDSFGASTAAAVRSFQASRGLGVDGVVGPVTRRALFL